MVCVFSLYLLFYFYLIFLIIFRTVYVFVHLNFQVALKCTDSYNSSRKIQLAMKIDDTFESRNIYTIKGSYVYIRNKYKSSKFKKL